MRNGANILLYYAHSYYMMYRMYVSLSFPEISYLKLAFYLNMEKWTHPRGILFHRF